MPLSLGGCVVCGESDARALLEVTLGSGASVILCGSHALIFQRSGSTATSLDALRRTLGERRGRRDRRQTRDELGEALASAFRTDNRSVDRRGTG